MREILFRGKRTDNGEWVKGFYCIFNGKKHLIYTGYAAAACGNYYPVGYEVDPKTIGQYTGMDDRNDTKIFEGDIVLVPYIDLMSKCTWDDTSLSERAIVRYVDGMFYAEYIEPGDKFTLSVMKGHMKIVGNIYDNKLDDFSVAKSARIKERKQKNESI